MSKTSPAKQMTAKPGKRAMNNKQEPNQDIPMMEAAPVIKINNLVNFFMQKKSESDSEFDSFDREDTINDEFENKINP